MWGRTHLYVWRLLARVAVCYGKAWHVYIFFHVYTFIFVLSRSSHGPDGIPTFETTSFFFESQHSNIFFVLRIPPSPSPPPPPTHTHTSRCCESICAHDSFHVLFWQCQWRESQRTCCPSFFRVSPSRSKWCACVCCACVLGHACLRVCLCVSVGMCCVPVFCTALLCMCVSMYARDNHAYDIYMYV